MGGLKNWIQNLLVIYLLKENLVHMDWLKSTVNEEAEERKVPTGEVLPPVGVCSNFFISEQLRYTCAVESAIIGKNLSKQKFF